MRQVVVVEKSAAMHEIMRNWIARASDVMEMCAVGFSSECSVPLMIVGWVM